MSDFEPTTDFPDSIDADDTPIATAAQIHDEAVQAKRKLGLRILVVIATIGLIASGYHWLRTIIAMAVMYLLLRLGMTIIGAFARPVPEPPPPGELRKVKLTYRCPTCGAELRMTLANDQMPAPPRHCADEMELTTNLEELL